MFSPHAARFVTRTVLALGVLLLSREPSLQPRASLERSPARSSTSKAARSLERTSR